MQTYTNFIQTKNKMLIYKIFYQKEKTIWFPKVVTVSDQTKSSSLLIKKIATCLVQCSKLFNFYSTILDCVFTNFLQDSVVENIL